MSYSTQPTGSRTDHTIAIFPLNGNEIDKGKKWHIYKKPTNYRAAQSLLSSFGGQEGQVYSFDILQAAGCEMGTGYTLEELTTLKGTG